MEKWRSGRRGEALRFQIDRGASPTGASSSFQSFPLDTGLGSERGADWDHAAGKSGFAEATKDLTTTNQLNHFGRVLEV